MATMIKEIQLNTSCEGEKINLRAIKAIPIRESFKQENISDHILSESIFYIHFNVQYDWNLCFPNLPF